MKLRLWRHQMNLRNPITSAAQVHATRTHLFLELEIDGVVGLGEVSPQPVTLNGDPSVQDVLDELEHFTLRQFVEASEREHATPGWARVTHFAGSRPASYPASALLEMALLDAQLRSSHQTIEDQWPVRFDTPVQRTVSLIDDYEWPTMSGAAQVRAKVTTASVTPDRWRQLAALNLPVLLDFNCSAQDPSDVLAQTKIAREFVELIAIEQPFAPGNVVEHARLASAMDVAISLDEGVRHRRDLDQIVRYGAASMVCIKPARVGGYAQARTMIERAQHLGLDVYLGGFFESPLARRAHRALARHLVALPSDIDPADLEDSDVLTRDPWGCGFLAGGALESAPTVLNRRW